MCRVLIENKEISDEIRNKMHRQIQIMVNNDNILSTIIGIEPLATHKPMIDSDLTSTIANVIDWWFTTTHQQTLEAITDRTSFKNLARELRKMSDEQFEQWLKNNA